MTNLRPIIAKHMVKETVFCKINDFFEHYFIPPNAENLKKVIEKMKASQVLVPKAPQKGATGKPKPPVPGYPPLSASAQTDLDIESPFTHVLRLFPRKPSEDKKRDSKVDEKGAFAPLEEIAQDIRNCMKEAGLPVNGFTLRMVPDSRWKSDVEGCNYKIDACITPNTQGETGNLHVAKMTMPFEFKLRRNVRGTAENRLQLVSAATHLMHDDVSRDFAYGMTIEDDRASLWHFSRGHSVKATSFSIVKRPDLLARVFVSLFSASREELGYSSHITRLDDGSYIYQLDEIPGQGVDGQGNRVSDESTSDAELEMRGSGDAQATHTQDSTARRPYFFRTTQIVSEIRGLHISGRNTRIWKAIEVVSKDDLTPRDGRREIILKDAWIDQSAANEFDIQQQLFRDIDIVRQGEWKSLDILKGVAEYPGNVGIIQLGKYLEDDSYKNLFLRFDEKMRHLGNPCKSVHERAWDAPLDVFGAPGTATDYIEPDDQSRRTGSMNNSSRKTAQPKPPRENPQKTGRLSLAPKRRCLFAFPDTCTRVSHLPTLGDAMYVNRLFISSLDYVLRWVGS